MTLLEYRIFHTVTQQGSFARAAQILHLTPSAISHAVSSMEESCGFSLFVRGKGGVSLTRSGEALYPVIRQVLSADEALTQTVAEQKEAAKKMKKENEELGKQASKLGEVETLLEASKKKEAELASSLKKEKEEVEKKLPGFPIVLHGSSSVPQEFVAKINQYGGNMPGAIGVPEDQLRKAASMAVCKINIDSDLRLAMTASIREYMALHPDHFDPRQYLKPARQAIEDMVAHKIVDVLGCDGKAF